MNEPAYERIASSCERIEIDFSKEEMANLAVIHNMSEQSIEDIATVFSYLEERKNQTIIDTCIKLSRLPKKEPKTFEGFDFSRIHGQDIERLTNLSSLSPLYSRKNLAFIGPQGVGKTHLAMAFGRKCCEAGMKTYFLKATELNQKMTYARKFGKIDSLVKNMVKPSCLIIDEVGRCVFDEFNTNLFFDIVDRRSIKEGPNCMIFTSNKNPKDWENYFIEKDSLLGAMDRFFNDALVFMIKEESYRGRKTETISLQAGNTTPVTGTK